MIIYNTHASEVNASTHCGVSRAVLGKSQTQRHFPMEPPRWSPEAMARSFGSLSASRSGNTEENLTWQRQLLRSERSFGVEMASFIWKGEFVFFRTFCIIFILTLPIFVSFSCDQTKIYGEIAEASGGSCGLQCHHECLPETCHWLVVHIVESACFFKMPLLIFQKMMSFFLGCFYMIQVW